MEDLNEFELRNIYNYLENQISNILYSYKRINPDTFKELRERQNNIAAELKLSDINLKCGDSLRTTDEVDQCNSNDSTDFTTSLTYVDNSLNDFYFPTDGSRNILKTTK